MVEQEPSKWGLTKTEFTRVDDIYKYAEDKKIIRVNKQNKINWIAWDYKTSHYGMCRCTDN